jgi:hypothetical protein
MLRRDFLKLAALGVAGLIPTRLTLGAESPRVLWLERDRRSWRLDLASQADYRAVCWILRDTAAGGLEALASPRLLLTAAWMQAFLAVYGVHRPFHVHSGFRTRATNTACGGARASQHLRDAAGYFHAIDIHMDGIPNEYLGRLAALAHQGGVGFYENRTRGFVHVDDGRVRYWRG